MKESTKQELDKIKSLTFGKRLQYIWDYYKWGIIGTIVAVIFIIGIAITLSSITVGAIHIYMSGTSCSDREYASTYIEDYYADYQTARGEKVTKIDVDNTLLSTVSTSDSVAANQLSSYLASSGTNIMISPENILTTYGSMYMYKDLSYYLPQDLYNTLLDQGALVEVTIPADTTVDPIAPETTFYAGIRVNALENCQLFEDAGYTINDSLVLGVPAAASKYEETLAFIEMLAREN